MFFCGVGVTLNFPCGLLWVGSYSELPMWFGVGWELHCTSHVVCCGVGVALNFPCGLVWGGSNIELPMWFVVGWESH